ncbi:MAG: HYR domain-containing protein [Saprospiraceae bacterium]
MKYHPLLPAFLFLTGFIQLSAQPYLNTQASSQVVSFSGSFEDFTVPAGITSISFEAQGGTGGSVLIQGGAGCAAPGGAGAIVNAVFPVGLGENEIPPCSTIRFVTGEAGETMLTAEILGIATGAGGGGGGSAVLLRRPGSNEFNLLVVAGGGGGAYQGVFAGICVDHKPGQGGRSTQAGGNGSANTGPGVGGTDGNGGGGAYSAGGGGGRFSRGGNLECPGGAEILGGKAGVVTGGAGGNGTSCSFFSTSVFSKGGFGYGGGGGALLAGLITGGSAGGGGGFSGGAGGGFSGGGGGGGSFVNTTLASQFNITPGGTNFTAFAGRIVYSCTGTPTSFSIFCRNHTVTLNEGNFASIISDNVLSEITTTCEGIGAISLSQSLFDCDDIGNNVVSVTANNGNNTVSSTCLALVVVVDDTPPELVCPPLQTLVLDGACNAILPDYRDLAEITENCGISSIIQSPFPGTLVSGAGQIEVTLTVKNKSNVPASCTFIVQKTDNTPPTITCPSVQTLILGPTCSAPLPNYTSLAVASDNCGVSTITQSPAAGTIVSSSGNLTITLTATDINGLTTSCTFTVTKVDHTPPTAVCFNQTLIFNGQENFVLKPDELADADDNCGVQSIVLNPSIITCTQLGQTIPVTATITDINGNTATCISQVAATGLPCGFSQQPDGVNCTAGNAVSFNPANSVFTVTSTNCYYANPFTSDAMAFAQQQLCGDGSITTQVVSISGNSFGWAGLIMRENNSAGAKKIQLMTNRNSNLSRREARYTTNAQAYPQQSSALNRFWLRLVRQGNQFTGYTSANGIQWTQVMTATINMGDCVEMGLVATNYQFNSTVTATFANVSITGGVSSLATPVGIGDFVRANDYLPQPELDFKVFPNPTTGQLSVDLSAYGDQKAVLEIRDTKGVLIKSETVNSIESPVVRFDLSDCPRGIYFIRVHLENRAGMVKRVVLQ